jgi:hypothetical protein
MKKILTFLLLVIALQLFAQENLITVNNVTLINPGTNIANWGTGMSVFKIAATTTVKNSTLPDVIDSKILVTIRQQGGSQFCGKTSSDAPPSNFIVNQINRTWSGPGDILSLGLNCKLLPPGSYELCVQFFYNGISISGKQPYCKPFTIKTEVQQVYQPPQGINPKDKTVMNEADAKKPLTFIWTPVIPKPKEPVVYKLRVFEVRQGQTATTAVKSGSPLLEKVVTDQTQYVLSSLSQLTIAKGSSYGWYVQALNQEGSPIGGNNGMSGNFVFGFFPVGCQISYDVSIDSIKCISADSVKICARFNCHKSGYGPYGSYTPIPTLITAVSFSDQNGNVVIPPYSVGNPNVYEGNAYSVCKKIKINNSITQLTIHFDTKLNDLIHPCINMAEGQAVIPECKCDPCKTMNIKLVNDELQLPNNGNPVQVNLVGTFNGLNRNLIKRVTAEIIYFNITQTEDINCGKCVYDSKYYGNFYPPASALPGYTGPVFNKPDYSRLITWNSTIIEECGGWPHGDEIDNSEDFFEPVSTEKIRPKTVPGDKRLVMTNYINPNPTHQTPDFILPIAVPELNSLSCCGDVIKICLRYTYYDFCCQTCEVIKCYEIQRN